MSVAGFDERILANVRAAVEKQLGSRRLAQTNLYVQLDVLEKGQEISAHDRTISLDRPTVMVFADEAPLFNWAHPCRYLLFDPEAGSLYKSVSAAFPPYLFELPRGLEPLHLPIAHPPMQTSWPSPWPLLPFPPNRGRRWFAVLFAGAANNRHTNDMEFLHRTLATRYGVPGDHIYVLNWDGTLNYSGAPQPVSDWPGNGAPYEMSVRAAATRAEFESVVDELKARLGDDDCLLLHTNNHGGHNGSESYLVTQSGPDYLASDLASKLGELPRFECLMVMMEQCHAGGFNLPILAQSPALYTSIASACEEYRSSIGGQDFDPFARDWISAMNQAQPDGTACLSNPDLDGDGRVGAEEAFAYAQLHQNPADTPSYSEASKESGDCYLGRPWPSWLNEQWLRELLSSYNASPEDAQALLQRLLPDLWRLAEDSRMRLEATESELRQEAESIVRRSIG